MPLLASYYVKPCLTNLRFVTLWVTCFLLRKTFYYVSMPYKSLICNPCHPKGMAWHRECGHNAFGLCGMTWLAKRTRLLYKSYYVKICCANMPFGLVTHAILDTCHAFPCLTNRRFVRQGMARGYMPYMPFGHVRHVRHVKSISLICKPCHPEGKPYKSCIAQMRTLRYGMDT